MPESRAEFSVLLLDGIDPAGVEILREAGVIDVRVEPKLERERLLGIVGQVDGIVVRSATRVDRELIDRAERLRVIGRAGVGVDNVDVDAATQRGVLVMNSPGGSTATTAEHTLAMMFALARNIPQACRLLKQGTWNRSLFRGVELEGKVLGVVGLGRIGSAVARKAQGLGMSVVAYDPFISTDADLSSGLRTVELDSLIEQSDFITLHTPLTSETRNLIDAAAMARMKEGVRLINCARGGLVDEKALYEALQSGRVAGAALDVFEEEPSTNSPLLGLDNFIATPHLGASTEEAQRKATIDIGRQLADYLVREAVQGALNFPQTDPAKLERYGHFVDLASRLASFLGQIVTGRMRVISIRYSGEACDLDLRYLTSTVVRVILNPILQEGVNLINAVRVAEQRGIRIQETRVPVPTNFANLIEIELETDSDLRRVSGTVFTDKVPRIVSIEGYALEFVPMGHMILLTFNDKPGVIGGVGTLLGERGVNVAGMHVGRDQAGGRALALLLVDDAPGDGVVDGIRRIPNVLTAQAIHV
jgi:D-3-phosphoglycerate dehydrogenase